MPELKSPSRCHGQRVARGWAQRTMSQLRGSHQSGLCDLHRVLGPLVHALHWEQTLVEDVQQDKVGTIKSAAKRSPQELQ